MIYRLSLSYLLMACLLTTSISFADNIPTISGKHFQTHCPYISELAKNSNHIWITRSKWQSFDPSFSEKLTHFKGAQWQGQHIGKLICIYTDDTSYTFPVAVAAPFLSYKPTDPKWKQHSQNANTYNCAANQVTDCTLIGIQKDKTDLNSPKKIEQFLQGLKYEPHSSAP